MRHLIRRATIVPEMRADWSGQAWRNVQTLEIASFHPRSSVHRPCTEAKLLYSARALHVLFRVADRYVRSVRTQLHEMVCEDSCVEIFLEPGPRRGYFNFEFNCGGTMLLYHIEDPQRVDGSMRKFHPVAALHAEAVRIATTMPPQTPVEITSPIEWRLEVTIPFSAMEPYVGPIDDPAGQTWRGNLFKCAGESSHPHWASWAPIGDELNFHQPSRFGELTFEIPPER